MTSLLNRPPATLSPADGVKVAGRNLSHEARQRLLLHRGEPMLFADWMRALMIHFEVDARELQRDVPFQLDLRDGRAFVSLVAFSMEHLHPRWGGKLGAWFFKPIATHDFLNVRTYVRHNGEPGIHFLAEWLSNRLAVQLGPGTFGLPYRHGRIAYQHHGPTPELRGSVTDVKTSARFAYRANLETKTPLAPCDPGSLDEWLMERYTAFNSAGGNRRFFRVWHPSWPQCRTEISLEDISLLENNWSWFRSAQLRSGNFSPGLRNVWMGRPHFVPNDSR